MKAPQRGIARTLNPEAGTHGVTSDPRELAALERASAWAWREFPYYEARYGARGKQFSLSDSAWIATVCGLPRREAVAQIRWLGVVLASRGMPRWLLERYLPRVYRELVASAPKLREHYRVLLDGAAALRKARRKRIPEARGRELAEAFEQRVAPPPLAGVGMLLVSAVADEADGIEHAVGSLETWLCDGTRFGDAWIAAVRDTIASARTLSSPVR